MYKGIFKLELSWNIFWGIIEWNTICESKFVLKCSITPINGGVVLAPKGLRFITVSFDEVNIVEEVEGEEAVA